MFFEALGAERRSGPPFERACGTAETESQVGPIYGIWVYARNIRVVIRNIGTTIARPFTRTGDSVHPVRAWVSPIYLSIYMYMYIYVYT